MSGGLKANGPSVEPALKGFETISWLADLTKSGAGRNEDLRAADYALLKAALPSHGACGLTLSSAMADPSPNLSFPITLQHEHRLIFTRAVFWC